VTGTAATAGAADQVTIGLIGCGGMGGNHLRMLAARKDVRVTYVCDPDANRLAAAAKTVESAGNSTPKAVKDLRAVLDDKTLDAVWIATPDHWHAPATILACDSGKHVYVEKPCSHNVREGRLMLEAARRTNKVVQVGTQARSSAHALKAVQLLREKAIGDVLVAKAWNSQLRGNIGKRKPSDPPAHLDFDLWLGPAPQRPYQSNLLHGIWRFWYDYGVGDIGNDGIHEIDVARWGLGVTGHPATVAAMGSKYFFDDDQQFPDNQYCLYEWPGDGQVGHKRQLIFEQRDWSPYRQEGHENGVAFYGTKGYMVLGKGSFEIFGPKNVPGEKFTGGSPNLAAHHQNFLDCIRSGKRPNADVEEGHLSATLAHLGNIACRVNRVLHFDPKTEQIVGDSDAGRLVRRTYREGHWAVPKGV
jgi:predicted dehydrogenase